MVSENVPTSMYNTQCIFPMAMQKQPCQKSGRSMMKTKREDFSANGLFTMSRTGSRELSHKVVEDYLSKGRYLQSVYVADLFKRLRRLPGAVLIRIAGRPGALPKSARSC